MVLYPDVQRRAREEIDRVVGPDRLPDFADRPALTYVEAVLREVWRWRPTNPLGAFRFFFSVLWLLGSLDEEAAQACHTRRVRRTCIKGCIFPKVRQVVVVGGAGTDVRYASPGAMVLVNIWYVSRFVQRPHSLTNDGRFDPMVPPSQGYEPLSGKVSRP